MTTQYAMLGVGVLALAGAVIADRMNRSVEALGLSIGAAIVLVLALSVRP